MGRKKNAESKELQVTVRREAIIDLRLKGLSIREVQEELRVQYGIEITHTTVWNDIKGIECAWVDRIANNMEELRLRQLEEIDRVKANCERFCDDKIVNEPIDSEDYGMQAKDYLKAQEIILKCLDMQTRLLGVNIQKDTPVPVKINTEQKKLEIFNELMARIKVKPQEKIINGECTEVTKES